MSRKGVFTTLACLYLSIALLFGMWTSHVWGASDNEVIIASVKGASTDQINSSTQSLNLTPYPTLVATGTPDIAAKEYVLYNPESGKTLFKSTSLEPVPIASTTKMMTTFIAVQHDNLKDITTISQTAAGQIGSLMGMQAGERISVENLLYGALLVSGNDAAYALAEYTGGQLLQNPSASTNEKIARFVEEMNTEAGKLYMQDTSYKDPVGLNDEGRSTALDLAKLASKVNEQPVLKKMINTATITVFDQSGSFRYDLHNSNRLLADAPYDGTLGGKTGFTPDAGHCLVTSAQRGGVTLTAVILHTNADTTEASAIEARKLLDFGFSSIRWQ